MLRPKLISVAKRGLNFGVLLLLACSKSLSLINPDFLKKLSNLSKKKAFTCCVMASTIFPLFLWDHHLILEGPSPVRPVALWCPEKKRKLISHTSTQLWHTFSRLETYKKSYWKVRNELTKSFWYSNYLLAPNSHWKVFHQWLCFEQGWIFSSETLPLLLIWSWKGSLNFIKSPC